MLAKSSVNMLAKSLVNILTTSLVSMLGARFLRFFPFIKLKVYENSPVKKKQNQKQTYAKINLVKISLCKIRFAKEDKTW